MKRTYVLFVATLLVATAFAQPKKQPAPEREGWESHYRGDALQPIYGDVKMVTVTKYYLSDKFGELVKGSSQYTMSCEFNQQGDVISCTHRGDSYIAMVRVWKYNSEGKVKDLSTYHRWTDSENNENSVLEQKVIYTYDSSGNLIELARYDDDGSLEEKTILRYDANGNAIEKSQFYSSGAAHSRRYFKYDTNGNIIEERFANSVSFYYKYKYDSWGNRIKVELYRTADGVMDEYEEYEYNSNGDMIRYSAYNYDNSLRREDRYSYVYDSAGNRIEKAKYYQEGPLDRKYVWKYDTVGNVVEETCFVGDAMVPEYIIEYDIVYREQNEYKVFIE